MSFGPHSQPPGKPPLRAAPHSGQAFIPCLAGVRGGTERVLEASSHVCSQSRFYAIFTA